MSTNFCSQCGNKIDTDATFCGKCGQPAGGDAAGVSPKSARTALLLCLFLGAIGAHRFYVGKIWTGLLMLLTGGGLGIWVLVDIVLIASCQFRDKQHHLLFFTQGKGSTVNRVLKVIVSVFAGIIIYVALLISFVFLATSGLVNTVELQLTAIRSGDLNKAYYQYTSTEFQKSVSRDTFEKFVNHYPALKNNKDSFFTNRDVSNDNGTLKGTVTSSDGKVTPIVYHLVKEGGDWKIVEIVIPTTAAGVEIEKPEKSAVSTPNSPLTYKDTTFNYTVSYPGNWEYEKPKPNHVLFGGKHGTPSYYTTVTIQVIPVKKAGGPYENITEIMQDLKQQITTGAAHAEITHEQDVELPLHKNEIKGKAFVATYVYKEVPMKKLQFVLENGKFYYAFSYTAPEKLYTDGLPIAKAMYESWDIQ